MIVDLERADGAAAPRRAAPAGSFLRRDGSRRTLLRPHQRRRPRLQDRRGAARRDPAEANWRDIVAHRDGCYLVDVDGSSGLARSAGARGEPPAPDRPRSRDRREPRRRLRRRRLTRSISARIYEFELSAHPFLGFRRWRGPRRFTTMIAPRASGRWSSSRSSRPASTRRAMSPGSFSPGRRRRRDRAGVAADAAGREA